MESSSKQLYRLLANKNQETWKLGTKYNLMFCTKISYQRGQVLYSSMVRNAMEHACLLLLKKVSVCVFMWGPFVFGIPSGSLVRSDGPDRSRRNITGCQLMTEVFAAANSYSLNSCTRITLRIKAACWKKNPESGAPVVFTMRPCSTLNLYASLGTYPRVT